MYGVDSRSQKYSSGSASTHQELSPKQAQVLTLIEEWLGRTGRPPTYRDLAKELGVQAVGTIQDHVRALIKKGYIKQDKGVARSFTLSYRSETREVPILGSVPAGRPIEAIESAQGSLSVPAQKCRGDLYALKVQGDSMIEAGIFEGDYVIVRQQAQADDGDIVVAMIDGEATVKTLEKKRMRVRLLPANPRYAPIELEAGRENVIQGKVVSIHRYY